VLHDGGPSKACAISKRGLATVSERSRRCALHPTTGSALVPKKAEITVSSRLSRTCKRTVSDTFLSQRLTKLAGQLSKSCALQP